MDGQPDDVDPAAAVERGTVLGPAPRLGLVGFPHLAGPLPLRPLDRTSKRLALVAVAVAVVFVLAVGVMLVVIRRHSNEQPAWVAQLGLDTGATTPDQPPTRLGAPAPGATTEPSAAGSAPPSTAAADDAPTIDTTGDDFDHVYRQIETLEGWLLTHPQPDRVADIYQPGTAPYTDLVGQLTQLRDAHQTLHVEDYRIIGVTVDHRPAADRVELRYADTFSDAVTTAAGSGVVISRAPYDGRARLWTLTLQRGDDGHWRVAATAFVQYGDVVPPA